MEAYLLLVGPEGIHHREFVELRPAGRRSAACRGRCPSAPQEHTAPKTDTTPGRRADSDTRQSVGKTSRESSSWRIGSMHATIITGLALSAPM